MKINLRFWWTICRCFRNLL